MKTLCIALLFFLSSASIAQDTLGVMTYNVLHYGNGCQGSNSFLHANLKTIIQYARPDVLGMVKAQTIKRSADDLSAYSSVGFADSILVNSFNSAFPDTYDYCPVVNFSGDTDGDMDLLFFNKMKLGFLSIKNLCSYKEDFNLCKLFYKDPHLATTKDTTFLYFILNHTVSGTISSERDYQDSVIVRNLKARFKHLPNLISMGDFNTHSSYEPGYQLLTATTDTSFVFSDPPYSPDKKLNYPSSWQSSANSYASYLNTSTREGTLPNACGSDGGAKGWYLHVLLSPWLVSGKNYMHYVPGSYVTLGNDGHRVGVSINDSTQVKNSSVPKDVLNALFQLSDKYPVMIRLAVGSNVSGVSPPDPEVQVITAVGNSDEEVFVENPIKEKIKIHFSTPLIGQYATLLCCDLFGRQVSHRNFYIDSTMVTLDADFEPGLYVVLFTTASKRIYWRVIKK